MFEKNDEIDIGIDFEEEEEEGENIAKIDIKKDIEENFKYI